MIPESAQLLELRHHSEIHIKLVGLSLFLVFAAISYWSMPSLVYQSWDSLANAYAVENNPLPLSHGNHPLVHLIQSVAYRVANHLGYDGRALTLLQMLNTLATAASIVVFYVILVRQMGLKIMQAAGWASFLGSGYSILKYAGTADIYSVSLLLLLIAWNSMLVAFARPDPYRLITAGVLIGVAGLAYQFGAILLGAGVLAGFIYQPRKATILGAVILATLVLGYGLLGYLSIGSLEPGELYDWIRGYVGVSSFGRSFSLEGVRLAMDSGSNSLIRKGGETDFHLIRMLLFSIIGFILFMLPFQRRLRTSVHIQTGIYCALPSLIGMPFIIWWDPVLTGRWWLLISPFLTAMLAIGLPDNKRWMWFVPMSLAVTVLLVNQLSGLQYKHKPDLVFEESLQAWIDNSSRNDVLYESDMFTQHLLFWGDRPETISAHLLIYHNDDINNPYRPLEKVIEDAWARGVSVLYTEGLNGYYDDARLAVVGASKDGLYAFFRTYRHEGPVFEYRESSDGPVKQVFRLAPPKTSKHE